MKRKIKNQLYENTKLEMTTEEFDNFYVKPITKKNLSKLCKRYQVYIWKQGDDLATVYGYDSNEKSIKIDVKHGFWDKNKRVKDFTEADWVAILHSSFS